MPSSLLSVRAVSKRYAVTVLDKVDFDLGRGEIHALLGSNGAGKSTLCRIIAGLGSPTSGSMRLDDRTYAPTGKHEAEQLGIQIVQQELCLIPNLSVAENLFLSRMPHNLGVIRRSKLRRLASDALSRVGLHDLDPDKPAGTLGIGYQQLVEIANALDRECRVLILDEPTSALSQSETEHLFNLLLRLRDRGIGIIYISHRLDEVARLADRVTVLRDGCLVSTCNATDITTDQIVSLMSGDPTSNDTATEQKEFSFHSHCTNQIALDVVDITRGKAVRHVSFQVKRGERLGIAGLVGSGRTELLRLIFGADPADVGTIRVGSEERPRRFRHPHEAVSSGLAMVTEDRKGDGLLLPLSVCINTSLASLAEQFANRGLIRDERERERVTEVVRSLDIRCNDLGQAVGTLSGGNQQKIAIGKWLSHEVEVILFDEPTKGIDVAARRRIYRLMETLAAAQKGIVIVSSDLEELLENCDRIAVMSAGKLVTIFERGQWSMDEITRAAFSGHIDN